MDPLVLVVMALVFATFVMGFQGAFMWTAMKQEAKERAFRRRMGLETEDGRDPYAQDDEHVSTLIRDQAQDAAIAALGDYGVQIDILVKASGTETNVTQVVGQMGAAGLLTAAVAVYVAGAPGILAGLIGGAIPYLLLQRKATERAEALLSQMPDALELMSRSMQTGNGLSDAFRLASEEMPEPLAFEFGRVYEEVRFGKEWRDAMDSLVGRNPTLFDLRLFVSSLLLQRDTGGNMIETLSNIAKTIRSRYVFDAKVEAMTSEARTSGFVLAAMPAGVILMIVLASPDYLTPLFTTNVGNAIVLLCLCMYGFGLYIMKITAQVEV
jgi:tight adherence protein B